MRSVSGFDPGGSPRAMQRQESNERCSSETAFVPKLSTGIFQLKYGCKSDAGLTRLDAQLQVGLRDMRWSSYERSSSPANELQILCEEGQLDKALEVLDRKGVACSVNMYKLFMKACTKMKALIQAKRGLSYLAKHGQEYTRLLGENAVSTLVRCGGLEDALQVFHGLPKRNVRSWTAIISGYTTSGQGRNALRMYHWMQQEGVQPNSYTIVSLLKACGSMSDLEEGRCIHREALKYRYESDLFVGTCLVDMYAKCGSIIDAQNVFDRLSHRDLVSWNVMLAAYAKQGQAEKALQLYEQMKHESASPNDRTFVSALQACRMLGEKETDVMVDGPYRKEKALQMGNAIYADARRKGHHSDIFVGSTLISMYGKFGSIVDAWNVFAGLPQKNVVSWNAIMTAYAQQSQGEKVMHLYREMCEEGVSPDERSFVCALQACRILAERETDESTKPRVLEMGRRIHAHVHKRGSHQDVFVASTLVSMYGKCGRITDAEEVFRGLSQKNTVLWTAMLAVYVEHGEVVKAWQFYKRMQEGGVSPGYCTVVSMLQACGILAENEGVVDVNGQAIKVQTLEKVKAIHVDMRGKGYDSDVLVGGFLVCMYNKCGDILDAHNVFDELPQQNVMAWTSILAATVKRAQAKKTLQLYEQLLEQGAHPYVQTFVVVLQACAILAEEEDLVDGLSIKAKSLTIGKALHADIWRERCQSDVFIGSTLISVFGKCGSILDAQNVFDDLLERDVVAWTAMLVAYGQHGHAESALMLYEQMQEDGVSPDVWTLVSALQSCGIVAKNEASMVNGQYMKVMTLKKGKAIHADACRKGYDSDVYISSALISMYGKCGSMVDAQEVFDGLTHRSVVACTAMLGAYLEQNLGEQALQLYGQMEEEGITLDEIALVSILQACSNTGSLHLCRQIHQTIVSTGKKLSTPLGNTLIHAYGGCASMVDAHKVFNMLPQPDVVSWNALIAGYARQGNGAASLQCYKNMRLVGTKPDGTTFLSLLSACSHCGLLDTGVEYLESMNRDYGITPAIEHYVSMIDLLSRAGDFKKVQDLLSTMPMQPNLAMCLSLLSACRQHGNVTLGRQAFHAAVRLAPDHTAAYFLMSNIYAEAHLQTCAEEVMDLRQRAGASKEPGHSWIGHEQEAQTFLVGDNKHPQHELLYDLLGKVSLDLKEGSTFQKMRSNVQ